MTKKQLKTATDSEVIVDYIETEATYCLNLNMGGGIDRLYNHLLDLNQEMLKRGILSQKQIDRLMM